MNRLLNGGSNRCTLADAACTALIILIQPARAIRTSPLRLPRRCGWKAAGLFHTGHQGRTVEGCSFGVKHWELSPHGEVAAIERQGKPLERRTAQLLSV